MRCFHLFVALMHALYSFIHASHSFIMRYFHPCNYSRAALTRFFIQCIHSRSCAVSCRFYSDWSITYTVSCLIACSPSRSCWILGTSLRDTSRCYEPSESHIVARCLVEFTLPELRSLSVYNFLKKYRCFCIILIYPNSLDRKSACAKSGQVKNCPGPSRHEIPQSKYMYEPRPSSAASHCMQVGAALCLWLLRMWR